MGLWLHPSGELPGHRHGGDRELPPGAGSGDLARQPGRILLSSRARHKGEPALAVLGSQLGTHKVGATRRSEADFVGAFDHLMRDISKPA